MSCWHGLAYYYVVVVKIDSLHAYDTWQWQTFLILHYYHHHISLPSSSIFSFLCFHTTFAHHVKYNSLFISTMFIIVIIIIIIIGWKWIEQNEDDVRCQVMKIIIVLLILFLYRVAWLGCLLIHSRFKSVAALLSMKWRNKTFAGFLVVVKYNEIHYIPSSHFL